MKRVGVLSNPRSGTSLMVHLLVTCFDVSETKHLFPYIKTESAYNYRITPQDLNKWGTKDYYVVFILRDPRNVIVSKHPSGNSYTINFGVWERNYKYCMSLFEKVNLHLIKFEDLLSEPGRTQRGLGEFLGVPTTCSFSMAHLDDVQVNLHRKSDMDFEMGGIRPLSPQVNSSWKKQEHRDRLLQQVKKNKNITDTLIELGYEKDCSWLVDL